MRCSDTSMKIDPVEIMKEIKENNGEMERLHDGVLIRISVARTLIVRNWS